MNHIFLPKKVFKKSEVLVDKKCRSSLARTPLGNKDTVEEITKQFWSKKTLILQFFLLFFLYQQFFFILLILIHNNDNDIKIKRKFIGKTHLTKKCVLPARSSATSERPCRGGGHRLLQAVLCCLTTSTSLDHTEIFSYESKSISQH